MTPTRGSLVRRAGSAAACALATVGLLGASASGAAAACPNEAIREQQGADSLPDCRAYELVSTNTEGREVTLVSSSGSMSSAWFIAAGGEAMAWLTDINPYGNPVNGAASIVTSRRTESGWSQSDVLAPPGYPPYPTGPLFEGIEDATADLGRLAISGGQPPESFDCTDRARDFLLWDSAAGSFAPVAKDAACLGGSQLESAWALRLSPDGSHALLTTDAQLAGDAHVSGTQLYEWTAAAGLRVFAVDDDGDPLSPCGAVLGYPSSEGAVVADSQLGRNPISGDGSRVFFTSPDPKRRSGCVGQRPRLYLREDSSRTVEISKPPAGAADFGAQFAGATADGSQAFFISGTRLTPDKSTEGDGHRDLFRYEAESGELTRLSVGPPGHDDAQIPLAQSAGRSSGLPQVLPSDDGSRVYFVGRGNLTPGQQNRRGETAQAGSPNLYLWTGGKVRFVAPFNEQSASGQHVLANGYLTPDGSVLAFVSKAQLTSYENEGRSEIYRYDASSDTIACVSCPADGSAPGVDRPALAYSAELPASFIRPPRAGLRGISRDGSTVVFDSSERLAAGAVNGLVNVYRWRDGQVSLISTGRSSHRDYLFGMSADGAAIFFATRDALVEVDRDTAYDLYAAVVGGGFPQSVPPTPCEPLSGGCQGPAPPPAAAPPPPGSEGFSGPGNAAPQVARTCPAGKVRRGGRCLSKRQVARRACRRVGGSNARRRCIRRQVRRLSRRLSADHRRRAPGSYRRTGR